MNSVLFLLYPLLFAHKTKRSLEPLVNQTALASSCKPDFLLTPTHYCHSGNSKLITGDVIFHVSPLTARANSHFKAMESFMEYLLEKTY